MSFTALQEELRKTGMPFSRSALQSSADEASTGDDSEGSSFQPASKRYMGSDATRYSSPTEDAGDGSPESVAPAPWTIPMPGSKHKELIPGQQEFYSNTDLFRVMQELQRATANPLDVVNPTPYLPQDAGYFSDELAKQWLQKEVAELADLMAQRESEMQSLHQQLTMISALQTPMSQPQAPQLNQGLEMQIHMLRNQLDEISQMMRLSQPGPPPQTFTKSQSPSQEDEILTVMMRNIPNKYTQKMLIEEVNSVGFQGTYDFVYLPIDKESGANKGYAFVNFLRPDYAYAFKRAFNG
ncbi:ML4, partial [Symbiodinium pilosum]